MTGKCEHQPVQRIVTNTPETHDPDRKARKIDAASDPQKFRMSTSPGNAPGCSAKLPGNPKMGPAMAAQETTVKAPPTTREKQLDSSANFVHTLEFPCPRDQERSGSPSRRHAYGPRIPGDHTTSGADTYHAPGTNKPLSDKQYLLPRRVAPQNSTRTKVYPQPSSSSLYRGVR